MTRVALSADHAPARAGQRAPGENAPSPALADRPADASEFAALLAHAAPSDEHADDIEGRGDKRHGDAPDQHSRTEHAEPGTAMPVLAPGGEIALPRPSAAASVAPSRHASEGTQQNRDETVPPRGEVRLVGPADTSSEDSDPTPSPRVSGPDAGVLAVSSETVRSIETERAPANEVATLRASSDAELAPGPRSGGAELAPPLPQRTSERPLAAASGTRATTPTDARADRTSSASVERADPLPVHTTPTGGPRAVPAAAHERRESVIGPPRAAALAPSTPTVGGVASAARIARAAPSAEPAPEEGFVAANHALTAALSRPLAGPDGTFGVSARLNPPALGHVDALVKLDGSNVTVSLVAHSPEGHRTLSSHLDELQRELEVHHSSVELSLAPGGGDDRPSHDEGEPAAAMTGAPAEIETPVLDLASTGGSLHVIL